MRSRPAKPRCSSGHLPRLATANYSILKEITTQLTILRLVWRGLSSLGSITHLAPIINVLPHLSKGRGQQCWPCASQRVPTPAPRAFFPLYNYKIKGNVMKILFLLLQKNYLNIHTIKKLWKLKQWTNNHFCLGYTVLNLAPLVHFHTLFTF